MGATSIHVQAVKPGSEIHNFREKELDYVRPELSHLNESWVGDSISHRLESAKQRYFDTVGQKMQTKAAPIREGVIVIKQETTMQELQQFAAVCKERFGIEAFQIHIHKDEGYMNAKQWTPNLHAHVVFDWTQPNGKSVRSETKVVLYCRKSKCFPLYLCIYKTFTNFAPMQYGDSTLAP
ncbi:hypothetical protein F3F35_31560 [Bacteroides ovatus]|nr:hypothetical protein F3F35_31560 [Bacteroides ovatus]